MSYARAAAGFLLVAVIGCAPSTNLPSTPSDPNGPPSGGGPSTGVDPGDGNGGTVPRPTATVVRVHYPAASHALALRGDGGGLGWDKGVTLAAGSDDTFTFSVADLAAPLAFKPLLDDATWSRGPNYVVAPGATVEVYPHFTTVAGSVTKLIATFHSAALGNDRAIWAYLPPAYAENTRARFPVLYMHDGQNLFDPALAFGGNEWKVDETLDAASEDGSVADLNVIGVENTAQRIYEYTPTTDPGTAGGGGGDKYLAMLVGELKPQIDQMLRTMPDRAHTGILGSSLGGLISAYAGVKRPDVYGIVGAMSPSTWWNNDVIIGDVGGMPAAMRPARVYVDSGDAGASNDDVTNTNMLAATYVNLGYASGVDFLHVVQSGGQHNEVYWAQRLPGALQFLFGPRP
ncbi:MAG: esterase family protein [bacterium]|nr:esterase family protein [bacterium]